MQRLFIILTLLLLLVLNIKTKAQSNFKINCVIEDARLLIRIESNTSNDLNDFIGEIENALIRDFGVDSVVVEDISEGKHVLSQNAEGWKLIKYTSDIIEIYKDLPHVQKNEKNWKTDIILIDDMFFDKLIPKSGSSVIADFGTNNFKCPSVLQNNPDYVVFFLKDDLNASKVFLSGTFNEWSTMQTPMNKVDSGWIAKIALEPGKYLYKFIIDGRWLHDDCNKQFENDGAGGKNSVLYVYNHSFELKDYASARKVFLAGTFNGWNPRANRMHQRNGKWYLPVYLKEGTHYYKFVVDRNWILDPENPNQVPDGRGNINSCIAYGDTTVFKLSGFQNAEKVVLTGSFNSWNENEIFMQKSSDGWSVPYILGAGNYEYKFIVDGNWISDPDNPFSTGSGDYTNSVIAVKPNHIFRYSSNDSSNTVIVTGSFNGWSRDSYKMNYENGEWIFPIYLPKAKYVYKFIVNGNWILDPANPLWEENEYDTDNSVLWIE